MKITSEEIRKSYPLTPRAVGMFDDDPIGVYSKYDKMNIVDMQGKVLFSYEPDHYLLKQVCFVNPYYILVVGGNYITANRIKVFNLKTKEWEFERLEIDCGDMMEACIAIHHSKPIVAIYRNDGVEIIDIKKRKTIELIANAESIAFCENGEILHTNFETLFLRSNSGQEITIEDFEYLDTTRWQDGYVIVLGEKSIRKVELNTLSIK